MKATELMIGDWVCYKGRTQIPARVLSFNNQTIKFDSGTPQDWMSTIENFEPIPLTKEILEKNGFCSLPNVGYVMEEHENEIIYDLWDHKLRILKNREQILNLEYFNEMCVHELQHALLLAGVEKKIEL